MPVQTTHDSPICGQLHWRPLTIHPDSIANVGGFHSHEGSAERVEWSFEAGCQSPLHSLLPGTSPSSKFTGKIRLWRFLRTFARVRCTFDKMAFEAHQTTDKRIGHAELPDASEYFRKQLARRCPLFTVYHPLSGSR